MQLLINRGRAKGKSIRVTGPQFVIGRDPECQLRPRSEVVSRRHAELKFISGTVVIFDLGSASGTRVNGQKLSGPRSLRTGDRIEIGTLSFTAVLDRTEQPKRQRRSIEDEVASWLLDDDDEDREEVVTPRVRLAPGTEAGARLRQKGWLSRTARAQRRSGGTVTDEDARDRFGAMTIRHVEPS